MSSQSLFKAGFVKLDADAVRVINSNDRISQKLESLREMPSYPNEIMEEEEAYMDEAENDETAAAEPDGQSDAQLIESSLDENATKLIEQANSRAEQIIAEANAQAQQIIADAQAQSQADAGRALEQAQQQGYTQGYSEGNQKAMQETQAKMAELSEKEAAMEREYQEKLDNVEPYLVDKLTDIYDHIFAVDLSEYRYLSDPCIRAGLSVCQYAEDTDRRGWRR